MSRFLFSFILISNAHAAGWCERVLSRLRPSAVRDETNLRIAWLTDIHLDFASDRQVEQLIRQIANSRADIVVISGDIATAPDLEPSLRWIEARVRRPVYFVLGNHDYYHGDVDRVRRHVRAFTTRSHFLHWLHAEPVVALTPNTALVGVDGWGDARLGTPQETEVDLLDFKRIENFKGLSRVECHPILRALGDESAGRLAVALGGTTGKYEEVIVVTHVPPFAAASYHKGQPEPADHLPYFACQAVGQVLMQHARTNPGQRILVLTGHTHSPADVMIRPNLRVIAGRARYRRPEVQKVLSIPR